MVTDARAHEAEDKERRELIEVKNRAENLAYQMEKLVKENKEKLSAESVTDDRRGHQGAQQGARGHGQGGHRGRAAASSSRPATRRPRRCTRPPARAGRRRAPAAGRRRRGRRAPRPGSQATPQKDDVVDAEFRQN